MKPEQIIGATVVHAVGQEGYGCRRCGTEPGRLELEKLVIKLLTGEHVTLEIAGVCPPDMETGHRDQYIVSTAIIAAGPGD